MLDASSGVVITDIAMAAPVTDRTSGRAAVDDTQQIWMHRTEQLRAALRESSNGSSDVGLGRAFPGVYFRDPFIELPVTRLASLPAIAFTTSERILLHLIERMMPALRGLPGVAHLSIGDPRDDINKQTFLGLSGVILPQALYPIVMDPLGLSTQTGLGRKPSAEIVTDASSSGAAALCSGAAHLTRGMSSSVIVVSATGKTLPIPVETFPLGIGPERSELPFEQNSSGHFYSEGGLGLVLHDENFARQHNIPVLARILATTYGSFGAGVVNRMVIADVVSRCLDLGGIDAQTPVFIDLYGRGNSIDDVAELSAIELIAKTRPLVESGYLKGDTHYMIGSHGLVGLVRLLSAIREKESWTPLAYHPTSPQPDKRSRDHFRADPATFTKFVFVNFSIHGSCIAVLIEVDGQDA